MDLLANYDDDNMQENSVSRSPSPSKKVESFEQKNMLENEWLSFEQMISQTGDCSKTVVQNDFLVGGVVAYPGMNSSQAKSAIPKLEKQLSNSSVKDDNPEDISCDPTDDAEMPALEEDDDAFFKLRKQVKELDRSSSSSSGSSSASSSRSGSPEKDGSPSPPHLSPQISLPTTTASGPPDITETATSAATEKTEEKASEKQKDHKTHRQSKSRERRDRKRSHRSKHHRSSKSRRHRSGSRSRDRRKRHDRHRRHRSKDRRSSKDETKEKENKDRRDSAKTEESNRKNSTSERKHSESKTVDSQSDKRHSRSKSRDRDRRKDKKEGRSRHRSGEKKRRSHSKDRKRSHSRDRKRSHSRDRKRSHSRDRKKKHRSRSRHRSRSPHRNKGRHSRSRSRERLRSRSPIGVRKLTFKEQMRKQFIDASKEMAKEKVDDSSTGPVRRPGQCLKPSDLLKGVKLNSGESVTPQMALMQTMAAMHKQAQELTGVEVPKYYNPAAVNPLKYAEQIKKRKLLWAKKDEVKEKSDQIETQWKSAFIEEDDGKTASKFRKLMGIKGQAAEGGEELTEDIQKLSEEQRRKHQELFDRLDQEYSFARMTTHTQRGVGLGFSSAIIDPNHPSVKPP